MKIVAAIALAMMASPALAQPPAQAPAQSPAAAQRPAATVPTRVNAARLTALCAQDRSACLTYVLGAVDAFAGALVASGRPQTFCVPPNTTNDQIAQRIVAYLRAHPEEGNNNAGLVVFAGMTASFPCGY